VENNEAGYRMRGGRGRAGGRGGWGMGVQYNGRDVEVQIMEVRFEE
jgi:hypothetical protein